MKLHLSKDLIIEDDGSLRECNYNIAKIGIWKSMCTFDSYKKCFVDAFDMYADALKNGFCALFYSLIILVMFPILPFVRAYFRNKLAVNQLRKELLLRAYSQLRSFDRCLSKELP